MRDHLLASIEFGVSPLVSGSYEPMRKEELHTLGPIPVQTVKPIPSPRYQRPRRVRGGIVTAQDILAHRGVVLS